MYVIIAIALYSNATIDLCHSTTLPLFSPNPSQLHRNVSDFPGDIHAVGQALDVFFKRYVKSQGVVKFSCTRKKTNQMIKKSTYKSC